MTDLTITIEVPQTPAQVYNAIKNVAAWWHGEISGSAKHVDDEFTYRMKEMHYSKQRVIELIPDQKVVWLVTDSSLSSFKDKSEWTGTHLVFEISSYGDNTQLRFTHKGLTPKFECYGGCSWGWGELIRKSLFSLITKGHGEEVFA